MKVLTIIATILFVGLLGRGASAGQASPDDAEQSRKAATVLREIMQTPDKAIPDAVLAKAECVAVFPEVIKAAFGIGGRGGRGVASCRTPGEWSAPAYLNVGGGSVGWQLGVQVTDFVFVFLTADGLQTLLSKNVAIGADASVAAGPVGRAAAAATDVTLNAEVLSYSRNKGLFAGLSLSAAVIRPDADDQHDIYGAGTTAEAVLRGEANGPATVRAFPDELIRVAPARHAR